MSTARPIASRRAYQSVLQELISGQIASSKNIGHANSYHPYSSNRGGYTRGGFRGKPRGRGRGRGGGSYSVDFRGGASTNAAASSPVAPSSEREEGEVTPPPPEPKNTATGSGEGWVKSSRRGNMSLMTVEKRCAGQGESSTNLRNHLSSLPPPARHPRVPPQVQVLQSTSQSTPGGSESKRVVIDGVIFQFEDGGKKLTRIGGEPFRLAYLLIIQSYLPHRQALIPKALQPGIDSSMVARATIVPRPAISCRKQRSLLHLVVTFADITSLNAKRAEQAKKPCRYFTKTGACRRPYRWLPRSHPVHH